MLGGVLVAAIGYAWTYTVDVVTFLAALYAVWRLPSLPPQREEPEPPPVTAIAGHDLLSET